MKLPVFLKKLFCRHNDLKWLGGTLDGGVDLKCSHCSRTARISTPDYLFLTGTSHNRLLLTKVFSEMLNIK